MTERSGGSRCVSLAFVLLALLTSHSYAAVQLTDLRVPNFVYSTEKNNLCISVTNAKRETEKVTVIVRITPDGGKAVTIRQSFEARPKREDSILVSFDMAKFPKRAGTIDVSLKIGDEETDKTRITVIDSLSGLKGVVTRNGRFYDADGNLSMICIVLEDPAVYRKWAGVKWLKRRSDTSPKRVVVLGGRMVNSLEEEKGTCIKGLKRLVEEKHERFKFLPRGEGLRPVFSDMLKAGGLARAEKADVFVYFPDVEDIYNSVPVVDFTRALDVLIDQVRRISDQPPYIILVTPVPMLSDLRSSARYDEAVRKIAAEHHTGLVDLREVLGKDDDALRASYGDTASNVFFRYPLEAGQKKIARAIMRHIH